jgi:hypothetical protein
MHPNRTSNKTKTANRPQKAPKDSRSAPGAVERHAQLDDDDDDGEDLGANWDKRSYPKSKNTKVVLDDDEDSGSAFEEEEEEEEVVVRGQVNSAAATTRPPLEPRNRRAEDEGKTRQHNELQEKCRKVGYNFIVRLF